MGTQNLSIKHANVRQFNFLPIKRTLELIFVITTYKTGRIVENDRAIPLGVLFSDIKIFIENGKVTSVNRD